MNLLLLTDGITPYNTGGMQKHSYIIAKLFAKNNINVTLVHCGFFNQPDFNQHYNDIFTKEELKLITPVFVPFLSPGKLPGHYIKESKTYSQNIKNEIGTSLSKFDLIYAQGFTGWHFLENKFKVPVVVNLHGFEMFQKAANLKVKLEHYLLRPFVKKTIDKADYILSFGGQIDTILKDLNIPDSKIIQQSNGIENNWIKESPLTNQQIRTITFIGRYERRKGVEELTKVLSELIKSDLKFKFNFIGPIPKEHQLKHANITYYGEIKDTNRIKELLDQSDFLISPSYAEGMPTVILEAMARGNSIIATDVGANSKMIKNNGILIYLTHNSIKEGILKAINQNDKNLLEMKQNSIHKVRDEFVWEEVIKNKIEFFNGVI